MTARVFNHGWWWTVAGALGAALGAVVLTGIAYEFSPGLAAVVLVAGGGLVVILAYPLVGICAGFLCAPLEVLDLDLGIAGLTTGEAVLLVTAASVMLRAMRRPGILRMSVPHAAFAVWIAITAVGLTFAPDDLVVFKVVVMWSAFLPISLYVASASRAELHWLLVAIAVAGASVSLSAVFSGQTIELQQGGATAEGRAQASFAHPAILAFFLLLALPCAICLGLAERIWLRVPMLIASGLILAALVLTLTRGAIIGAAVVLLMLLWLPRFRLLAATLLVGLLIFGAANLNPILNSPQASVVATRLGTIGGSELKTNPRLRIYRGAPAMVIDHPFFGIGAANFSKVSPLYGLRDIGGDIFEHAHNVFLTAAVETGLFGLLALLVFVAGLVRAGATVLRARGSPDLILAMAPVAALTGLLACSMTDYPLRTNLIMALLMVHAGALIAYARTAESSRDEAEAPMDSSNSIRRLPLERANLP